MSPDEKAKILELVDFVKASSGPTDPHNDAWQEACESIAVLLRKLAATEPTPPTGEPHAVTCCCPDCERRSQEFRRKMADLGARPKPTEGQRQQETIDMVNNALGPLGVFVDEQKLKDFGLDKREPTEARRVPEGWSGSRLFSEPTDAAKCECDACLGFASGECRRGSTSTPEGEAL